MKGTTESCHPCAYFVNYLYCIIVLGWFFVSAPFVNPPRISQSRFKDRSAVVFGSEPLEAVRL